MRYASVSVTNTPVATLVAAGRDDERVRLTGGALTSNAATTLLWISSTGNTALSGTMNLAAGTPFVLPASPASPGSGRRPGYLQSAIGDSLQLQIGSGAVVSGFIEYAYVAE